MEPKTKVITSQLDHVSVALAAQTVAEDLGIAVRRIKVTGIKKTGSIKWEVTYTIKP